MSHKKPKTINPNEVDPSVYYYDEVYDDMKAETEPKTDPKTGHKQKKESKYMKGLIEAADQRSSEKEIRKFKKFARDRAEAEAEGELADTDVYYTKAYKRKLSEIEKLESEKKRLAKIEEKTSMNFTTKTSVDKSHSKKTSSKDDKVSDETESNQSKIDLTEEPTKSEPSQRKRLKNKEERREYLRELLAKRTVGIVYEEARKRFKERRALHCH